MKKEIKIAKENVEMFKRHNWKSEVLVKRILVEHKQTCERFLEFFDEYHYELCDCTMCLEITKKIRDLKKAIKLYEDNGI